MKFFILLILILFGCAAAFSFSPSAFYRANVANSAHDSGVGAGQNYDTARGLLISPLYDNRIGYRALDKDNTPCPPSAAGRSYYTPNCFLATGPINPYTRGCSRITHCARDIS
ncbi:hypothetical protein L7F22_056866 [Adiantum nelumboides]|nr:hypothetical protein [Adiantum nelumboides]